MESNYFGTKPNKSIRKFLDLRFIKNGWPNKCNKKEEQKYYFKFKKLHNFEKWVDLLAFKINCT